jgi:sulfatase maturation enzyme AslB (radical SAM superfamily)
MSATAGTVLADALALATTGAPAAKPVYMPAHARPITRRGILWLGQTCNLRCRFCYFLDRIENADHPEHAFMSLAKAEAICRTLVDYYGNNSIDIQGGEPTLWPRIYELVAYCAEIGLSPTIITNAQVLSRRELVARYRQHGLRDFLVSVQGLGRVYDDLVRQEGAHVRQMQALRNLQEEGVPFRFNTVLTKPALAQLVDIAELAVRTGAEVVNFLGFNPFNDQETGKRSAENVPRYGELRAPLDAALDVLTAAGVEANVRYLPFCTVSQRHRQRVYDFAQIPYDLHENDFASWSWTDLPAQRMGAAPMTPPFGLGQRLTLGPLRAPLRRLAAQMPRVGEQLHEIKQHLERRWAAQGSPTSREQLYREDARMRAHEYTGYRHVSACERCDARPICDGFHADYVVLFGDDEAKPIDVGGRVADPRHFCRHQTKRIHPDDARWLGEPPRL